MDCDFITAKEALEALENMDDLVRMFGVDPYGPYGVLKKFIEQFQDVEGWVASDW